MKLSVIYVNYNTTELLLESMRSLRRLDGLFTYEVIVVDNASAKFDAAAVRAARPDAKVIVSEENLGFGKGNNLGAKAATGEYLWILNTDTVVPEDHNLGQLVKFLDEHSEYGAALPLLVNAEGSVQPAQTAHFPSPVRVLMRKVDYAETKTMDVEVAVAAALFIRRAVYERVGGFSPEFFMFFEDSDLCHKIGAEGLKIRFMAETKMIHLWGQSIRGKRSFSQRKKLYFRSQDIYMRKWHGGLAVWLIRVLRLPLVMRYRLVNR